MTPSDNFFKAVNNSELKETTFSIWFYKDLWPTLLEFCEENFKHQFTIHNSTVCFTNEICLYVTHDDDRLLVNLAFSGQGSDDDFWYQPFLL